MLVLWIVYTVLTLTLTLTLTMRAGAGAKLQYTSTVVRRSWAGDDAGRSVFAEVETLNDTEGMD